MRQADTWHVIARCSDVGTGLVKGEETELPADVALELVLSQRAWISRKPDRPPYTLLQFLQGKIAQTELLGPPHLDVTQLAAIQEAVFAGGIRQSLVAGHPLKWWCGKTGLREMAGRRLSKIDDDRLDPFFLLRFLAFESAARWARNQEGLREQVYGQEYARKLPDPLDDFDVLLLSRELSGEWHDFTAEALTIQGEMEQVIAVALREGRILVGQQSAKGDRFMPPQVLGSTAVADLDESYFFALSSELQETSKVRLIPLHARRKTAAGWIEAAFEHFSKGARRFTAADAQTVVQEKFDLKPNAARDTWRLADIPKSEFRNPKKNQRVTIAELRAFQKIEGKK